MTTSKPKTRAELEAKIAELEADAETVEAAPVASTRARSPRKPRDHKPAAGEMITFDFLEETYVVDARYARDVRTAALFNKNNFEAAISKMIGEDAYEELLDTIEDDEGFVDAETLGEWVNAFFEAAGAKN